jgi:lysozyme family protein
MTDDDILSAIVAAEGGYVNNPNDAGRGKPMTEADIKALTVEEAKTIYRKGYLAPFAGITSPELRHLVVDCAVNHGVGRAAKWLQKASGVAQDGDVGPATLEALGASHWKHIYLLICAERVRFYGNLVTKTPSQAVFAAGWNARVAQFIEGVA